MPHTDPTIKPPRQTIHPATLLNSYLLATTILASAVNVLAAISREQWRMVHQTRAMISHYNRRGDPLPTHLRI